MTVMGQCFFFVRKRGTHEIWESQLFARNKRSSRENNLNLLSKVRLKFRFLQVKLSPKDLPINQMSGREKIWKDTREIAKFPLQKNGKFEIQL